MSSNLLVGLAGAEKSSLSCGSTPHNLSAFTNKSIPLPYIDRKVVSKPWSSDDWKHSVIFKIDLVSKFVVPWLFGNTVLWSDAFSSLDIYFGIFQKQCCSLSAFILPTKISQAGCLLIS